MLISRCGSCPRAKTGDDGKLRCESTGFRYVREPDERLVEPDTQPAWCPLPEEDPMST